jgi:hypothetical protein
MADQSTTVHYPVAVKGCSKSLTSSGHLALPPSLLVSTLPLLHHLYVDALLCCALHLAALCILQFDQACCAASSISVSSDYPVRSLRFRVYLPRRSFCAIASLHGSQRTANAQRVRSYVIT